MSRYQTQKATADDIDDIIAIKKSMHPSDGGGFILGSSYEDYCRYVEHGIFKTLKSDGELVGYAIVMPDAMLRKSELWQKKDKINFSIPITAILDNKIFYFEQLAILPRCRYHLAKLLLPMLDECFEQHEHMFATTVCEPFVNTAAYGLYLRANSQTVGKLSEFYPGHGTITSQLHYLSKNNYLAAKRRANRRLTALGAR